MELLWILLFAAWIVTACVALLALDRHGRGGAGFALGLFFGPLGVLIAVIMAANLDREKSDKETRELLREEMATRKQLVERAVIAALAVHGGTAHAPEAPSAPPPASRTLEEIHASEPRNPRRFR